MKLFLTATSERGKPVTKSGNDFVAIEVMDSNHDIIGRIRFTVATDSQGDITRVYYNFADYIYPTEVNHLALKPN